MTVFLLRDGIVERWYRTGAHRDGITVTLADGSTEELTIPAAQQRFRARAFYQKQLSTLVKDRRRAGEQITGIAAAESVDLRRIVDQQIGEAKREVQTAFQQLIEFWVADADHNQSLNSIADLNRRIDAVKKRLEGSGVTPENQKLLDAAPAHNLANALVREAGLGISSDIAKLREAFATVPSIDPQRWSAANSFEEVGTFLSALSVARERISESLTGAIEALETLAAAQEVMANDFKTRRDAFAIRHRAAVEEQAGLKSIVEESQKLLNEIEAAETTERRSAARVKALERAPLALSEARTRLLERLDERRTVLQEAATKVQSMSHGSLRAEVRREQVPGQYVEALLAICEGRHVRGLDSRCEDRVRELMDPQILHDWGTVTDLIVGVYKYKIQTGAATVEAGDQVGVAIESALVASLTTQAITGIYKDLEDSHLAKMLVATPDDQIAFEYSDATGYIPFEQASPGQQAAALLDLLLTQEAGTLVIDQPEEDLDNKVIMTIVHLLQTTKRTRQLLFATHNPNFVVNGDADKVIALTPGTAGQNVGTESTSSSARISIEIDGAIETPSVRNAITETMEGGQAAFELRSRKYMFRS